MAKQKLPEKDERPPKKRKVFVPVPKKLGQKLRQIRLRKNLTQGKMIRIVNPLQNTEDNRARISLYENGKRVPSLIEVYNYAKFYGVSMEHLVDDDLELPDGGENY